MKINLVPVSLRKLKRPGFGAKGGKRKKKIQVIMYLYVYNARWMYF